MHCKTLKKIILFISIILLVLTTFSIYVRADDSSSLYLDKLKFDVTVNEDGSMDVVETWDIDISHVNTLYKTFKMDDEKIYIYQKCKSKRYYSK